MMTGKKLLYSGMLLLAAIIWGVAFVAQSVSMEYVAAFTFNAVRCFIGGVVLIPCIFLLNRFRPAGARRPLSKTVIIGGISCGVVLFAASNLQQFGIGMTTVGKAGFITAFYIVLVPVFGLFLRQRTGIITWIGVLFALAGLYFLCLGESFSIGAGDLLVFCSAVVYAIHILVIDRFSPLVDGVVMSCIQFFTCSLLSGIGMFLFEAPSVSALSAAWLPILYAGAGSCGVAYTLQIIGQKELPPALASLLLSMESVVSVIAGWAILHQALSARELLGCSLMLAAVLLVECIPGKTNKTKKASE